MISLFISSCDWWSGIWGNHPLGSHLSLWDGDKKEDRAIVYCEGNCHGGILVVPIYSRQFDEKGNYAEYVETVASNKKWIIVKTYQIREKKENYWIISKDFDITNLDCSKANCDSILQSYVTGPLNLTDFKIKLETLNIDLRFK